MEGVIYSEDFLKNPESIFLQLLDNVDWDERMNLRKTASYGVAYNYSQMTYPFQPMLPFLREICKSVNLIVGFEPNNCLINYYLDGNSKMGFHADRTDILADETGVVIVSIGHKRILRFRNIKNKELKVDYELASGSLFYMTQDIQMEWEHAVPPSINDGERISLTLRKIK